MFVAIARIVMGFSLNTLLADGLAWRLRHANFANCNRRPRLFAVCSFKQGAGPPFIPEIAGFPTSPTLAFR
jgi:hypothetical protein